MSAICSKEKGYSLDIFSIYRTCRTLIYSVPGWELNCAFIKYVGLTRPVKRDGSVHKY